jgi:hypothetical protein
MIESAMNTNAADATIGIHSAESPTADSPSTRRRHVI